jgi:hypothetical protein
MTTRAHTFSISQRTDRAFISQPIRYRAECECGFVGEWRPQRREAEADGLLHQATATEPPLEAA